MQADTMQLNKSPVGGSVAEHKDVLNVAECCLFKIF